jgi:hypothetical protein
MSTATQRTRRLGLLAISVIALAGCGSGATHSSATHEASSPTRIPVDDTATPAIGGNNQTGGPIARIGSATITKAAFDSRMAIEARTAQVPLTPPLFHTCIKRLQHEAREKGTPVPAEGQVRSLCRSLYQNRRERVLTELISGEWAIGAAKELHTPPTDAEDRQRLERSKARQFGSEAKFKQYLAQSGDNVPDVLFNLEVQIADERLLSQVKASTPHVTPQEVEAYYQAHKRDFAKREQRDIGIIRSNHRTTAIRVKHELESGVTVSALVRRLKDEQPIYSVRNGLVTGLEPHVFSEKPLNDAIFSARPHVVSGPVFVHVTPGYHGRTPDEITKIDGYYVFIVNKVTLASQGTLAQSRSTITKLLPEYLHKQALRSFVQAWRAKWRARTSCSPGYVVAMCRQFRRHAGEPAENLYSLD